MTPPVCVREREAKRKKERGAGWWVVREHLIYELYHLKSFIIPMRHHTSFYLISLLPIIWWLACIMSNVDGDDNGVGVGICKATNEEHARDLPIMNGIKEDIKSLGVLDSGSPIYQEALSNLSTRLKSLRVCVLLHLIDPWSSLGKYFSSRTLLLFLGMDVGR